LRMSECGTVANLSQLLVRYRVHGGNVDRSLGVRQAFSVRLARTASVARRCCGFDPAERLLEPPDWWGRDAESALDADAAQLFRFLELAHPKVLETGRIGAVRPPSLRQALDLSHDEKRLAGRATFNLLVARHRPAGLSLSKLALMIPVLLVGRPLY